MIAAIEAREVSHVLVKDLSRVGRDYLQVGFYEEQRTCANQAYVCT